MRIAFHKVSDERHVLEVVSDDGRRERVDCESRSYLTHDLLHYAVETEAGLQIGFWGRLAGGATLAEMNDRTKTMDGEIAAVEQVVGALSPAVKGRSAAELVAGMKRYATSLGATLPEWLTEPFILAVQEHMRQLMGHWRATPYGGAMELAWPSRRLSERCV